MTPHQRHQPGDDTSPGDDDRDARHDARRRRAAEALFLGSRNHGGRPKKEET